MHLNKHKAYCIPDIDAVQTSGASKLLNQFKQKVTRVVRREFRLFLRLFADVYTIQIVNCTK